VTPTVWLPLAFALSNYTMIITSLSLPSFYIFLHLFRASRWIWRETFTVCTYLLFDLSREFQTHTDSEGRLRFPACNYTHLLCIPFFFFSFPSFYLWEGEEIIGLMTTPERWARLVIKFLLLFFCCCCLPSHKRNTSNEWHDSPSLWSCYYPQTHKRFFLFFFCLLRIWCSYIARDR
jgi:hypothetical protein